MSTYLEKVRKANRERFVAGGSYPLQNVGTVAAGGSALPVSRGQHQVLLGGSTGIVATQFGLHSHGITVGRLATGIYGIAFPDMAHVRISPDITTPTGSDFNVAVRGVTGQGRVVGATGFAELHITSPIGQTGARVEVNPSTGTVVTLEFEFSPKYQHDGNTLIPY